ncbi:MAG: preprotein translocase subunit SecE [Coriobacteriales bacterium]|jgi:preprotein translocase subunit SecE|nr:preprotein translocase subunit SecE [Coriobacteriales bacterium]
MHTGSALDGGKTMAKSSPAKGAQSKKNSTEASKGSSKSAPKSASKNASKKESAPKNAPKSTSKGSSKGTSKSAPKKEKKESIFRKAINYFHNVRLEIKRTTWPSRDEVLRMSLIVIGALIFFGVFILVADWIMTSLLNLYSGLATSGTPTSGGQ